MGTHVNKPLQNIIGWTIRDPGWPVNHTRPDASDNIMDLKYQELIKKNP